ncbi:MAG: hypothetical protein JSV80_00715 [Acidobacteriota bacterium]|nr:MAG: hypothetical protein JSV80_00715 [Acidobacteriota bacterium]
MQSVARNRAYRTARAELDAPPKGGAGALAAALGCGAMLLAGWSLRNEGYLRPESGLGYRLGIAAAASMLLLLLYSARKRIRALHGLGALRHWFRVHMILGVLGPMAVLFHCNFNLGSLNSRVALGSTLLVAASGLFGRFIYTKVHYGLYGRQVRLEHLRSSLSDEKSRAARALQPFPSAVRRLRELERLGTAPVGNPLAAVARVVFCGLRVRRFRAYCFEDIAAQPGLTPTEREHARRAAREYMRAVQRVSEFSGCERLFRLWHAFHVPLFVLLLTSVMTHVLAVHMY